MDDVWHDRLFAAVPYLGAGLLAVVAAIWFALDGGDGGDVVAEARRPTFSGGSMSLVVVEADWCGWCKRFRRDVAPKYEESPYASRVPLHYVQLDQQGRAGFKLASRVRSVPTFVLVDGEGREIDRLRGYPGGPDRFFAALDGMLSRAR